MSQLRPVQQPIKRGTFKLCGLPWGGYRPGYITVTRHPNLTIALMWGERSGLSAWTGESATRAGYGPEGRLGRQWIEAEGQPATRKEGQ